MIRVQPPSPLKGTVFIGGRGSTLSGASAPNDGGIMYAPINGSDIVRLEPDGDAIDPKDLVFAAAAGDSRDNIVFVLDTNGQLW